MSCPPGCRDAVPCEGCFDDVCPMHDDDLADCVDGGFHHSDCLDYCDGCTAAERDRYDTDLADAQRKGER